MRTLAEIGLLLLFISFILFFVFLGKLTELRNRFRPIIFRGKDGKLYQRDKKPEDYPDPDIAYHVTLLKNPYMDKSNSLKTLEFTFRLLRSKSKIQQGDEQFHTKQDIPNTE
jgi:hypothetical protein